MKINPQLIEEAKKVIQFLNEERATVEFRFDNKPWFLANIKAYTKLKSKIGVTFGKFQHNGEEYFIFHDC